MNPDQIWHAIDTERAALADLVDGLAAPDWDRASLCAEWRIRDVVAHIILASEASLCRILIDLISARGNLDRLIRDTALRRADRPYELLAVDLRNTVGDRFAPFGTTPTDRLMDLLVHGQDIAIPLGLHRNMPLEAARVAAERVWTMRMTFHPRRALAGYRLEATDTDWTVGKGTLVEAPIADLLMLMTGRTQLPS